MTRHGCFAIFVAMSCGCAAVDGVYEPGCMSHAGDRIVLERGRYSWKKYTDEIRLDESGRRIDPFPGFPVSRSTAVTMSMARA